MRAKKSLGQHFLNSSHVLGQIIAAACIRPGETVLEIGPGTGVLTEALLEAGARVVAVEKDDRAHSLITDKFAEQIADGRLRLIHGDILELDILSILPASYALVANIPYYITGAILEKFLEHEPRPDRMVLLVQKEVADRIVARDDKESILSISVKAFGTPRIIAKVPPGAFTPPPSVDSAILAVSDISDKALAGIEIKRFFDIVRAGFAHKRKFAKRNLETVVMGEKEGLLSLESAWKKSGLDEKARAEDIKLEQWFSLSTELRKSA